jgi:hypothetical protein
MTGDPANPSAVAVSVLIPVAAPTVQLPTVAIPSALVVAELPVTLPPPLPTANVTVTPLTGLLSASVILTDGGIRTCVLGAANWLLPAFMEMVAAEPA